MLAGPDTELSEKNQKIFVSDGCKKLSEIVVSDYFFLRTKTFKKS